MESIGELQDWLNDCGLSWRELRKPELLKFFARWREAFEPLFETGRPIATGESPPANRSEGSRPLPTMPVDGEVLQGSCPDQH